MIDADDAAISKFVGLVSAQYVDTKDGDALGAAFKGIPNELADALGREVCEFLFSRALETGDFKTWATALHHVPSPYRRAAAKAFWDGIRPGPAPETTTRAILSRACFSLLKRGAGARSLVQQVRDLNRMQAKPLPDSDLEGLILWAAERHRANAG